MSEVKQHGGTGRPQPQRDPRSSSVSRATRSSSVARRPGAGENFMETKAVKKTALEPDSTTKNKSSMTPPPPPTDGGTRRGRKPKNPRFSSHANLEPVQIVDLTSELNLKPDRNVAVAKVAPTKTLAIPSPPSTEIAEPPQVEVDPGQEKVISSMPASAVPVPSAISTDEQPVASQAGDSSEDDLFVTITGRPRKRKAAPEENDEATVKISLKTVKIEAEEEMEEEEGHEVPFEDDEDSVEEALKKLFKELPKICRVVLDKMKILKSQLQMEIKNREELREKMETEREKAAKVKKELREKYGQAKVQIATLTREKEALENENALIRDRITPFLEDPELNRLCGSRRQSEQSSLSSKNDLNTSAVN